MTVNGFIKVITDIFMVITVNTMVITVTIKGSIHIIHHYYGTTKIIITILTIINLINPIVIISIIRHKDFLCSDFGLLRHACTTPPEF